MIYIILAAIHLLACLLIWIGILRGKVRLQKYMIFVALLLPFWGIILLLILHFEWGFDPAASAELKESSAILHSSLHRSVSMDEKRSDKTVPIEEALLINSPREKRTIIMDILNENPRDYVELLQKAGNNDDTEVVHYAVTAMVEISKENDYAMQTLEREYAANPYDLGVLTRYCDFLWDCLTQNLMQGQIEIMNRNLFSRLVTEKLAIYENLEDYNRLAENELNCGNAENVRKILETIKDKWPDSEEYILLNIQYLALMNEGSKIQEFIDEINNNQTFLSSKAKEVLAFWAD